MAVETPLAFLRAIAEGRPAAPVTIFFGPQAFLREYALESLRRRLANEGFKYRSVQIGAADTYANLINELEAADLFAAKRMVVGRVLKSHRERNLEGDVNKNTASGSHDEAALIAVGTHLDPGIRLALVYEREQLPPRIRRAFEESGILVNCQRPFDSQLVQYADLFARMRNISLTTRERELLITAHGGDLAAIANSLDKAVITHRADSGNEVADPTWTWHAKIPELFDIAQTITQQRIGEALALFDRATQTGRDPTEVLALELIPQIRRMLLAATLLRHRKDPRAIAAALGLSPNSPLASRAVEGAKRFGLERLQRVHQRACALDASFKNGTIKYREQAVAALILELASDG